MAPDKVVSDGNKIVSDRNKVYPDKVASERNTIVWDRSKDSVWAPIRLFRTEIRLFRTEIGWRPDKIVSYRKKIVSDQNKVKPVYDRNKGRRLLQTASGWNKIVSAHTPAASIA